MSTKITGATPGVQRADESLDNTAVQSSGSEKARPATVADGFNLQTPEGQQEFKEACLKMGLSMLEFVGDSSSYVESLSPQAQSTLTSLASNLTNDIRNGADPAVSGSESQWAEFIEGEALGGGVDANALVQQVLRESYLESTQDLYFHATKVKFFNELKKGVREELSKAREELVKHAGGDANTALTYDKVSFDGEFRGAGTEGALEVVTQSDGQASTKAELETYIENLEQKMNSIGDDAQLANVDLQNMLQKQQQTMQMMSNISKLLHDTAMAIIRKIG
jgi:hypothetical protein